MTGRKYSEERRKNIGAARLIHLSADTLAELNRLLEIGMPDGYIRNVLKVSRKVYQRHKATIYPNGIPWQLKWLENNIEPLAIEKIVEQTKNGIRYKKIAENIGLHHKTVRRIIKLLGKKDPQLKVVSYDKESWSVRRESSIELLVKTYLQSAKHTFQQEVQIEEGSKWFFDFQLTNTKLLLEIQGDYWHCNPSVFETPKNEYQKWAIKRDYVKKAYAKSLGYKVIPLWENDLKTNKEETFKKLEEEIQKCKPTQ